MTAFAPTRTAYAPTQAAVRTAAARQTVSPARATAAAADYRRIAAACASDDPYFVFAHKFSYKNWEEIVPQVAAGAFNVADPLITVAKGADIGPVYGLAYDARRAHLYAAAVDSATLRASGFGTIYRIELATGRWRHGRCSRRVAATGPR